MTVIQPLAGGWGSTPTWLEFLHGAAAVVHRYLAKYDASVVGVSWRHCCEQTDGFIVRFTSKFGTLTLCVGEPEQFSAKTLSTEEEKEFNAAAKKLFDFLANDGVTTEVVTPLREAHPNSKETK